MVFPSTNRLDSVLLGPRKTGSYLNEIQGRTTVWESYSRALEQGSLLLSRLWFWLWRTIRSGHIFGISSLRAKQMIAHWQIDGGLVIMFSGIRVIQFLIHITGFICWSDSDNPVTVTVFWSQEGSSYPENHWIEWHSLTVTLFRFPKMITVTDRACTVKPFVKSSASFPLPLFHLPIGPIHIESCERLKIFKVILMCMSLPHSFSGSFPWGRVPLFKKIYLQRRS